MMSIRIMSDRSLDSQRFLGGYLVNKPQRKRSAPMAGVSKAMSYFDKEKTSDQGHMPDNDYG